LAAPLVRRGRGGLIVARLLSLLAGLRRAVLRRQGLLRETEQVAGQIGLIDPVANLPAALKFRKGF